MQPEISVVIPAFNARETLRDAVESALAQTLPPSEIIVVDDVSTDGTRTLIQQLALEHDVTAVLLDKNRGGGFARNAGALRARGEYIAFLDSDDVWRPDKLERQVRLLSQTTGRFCFSAVEQQLDDGKSVILPRKWPTKNMTVADFLLRKGGIIQTSTILIRSKDFHAVRFHEDLRRFQDLDLALRLEQHGILPIWDGEPTTIWRSAGGKSRVTRTMKRHYIDDFLSIHNSKLTGHQLNGFLARNPSIDSVADSVRWSSSLLSSLLVGDLRVRTAGGLVLRLLRKN